MNLDRFLDVHFLVAWLWVIAIDIVLSGDNAVVIAMAIHRLPTRQRRVALWIGIAAAIGLRVAFTAIVGAALEFPYLRLCGGLVIIWIAIKLLVEEDEAAHQSKSAVSLWGAVWTITLADLFMSLDNMLAVGGAAGNDLWLLIFGLVVSILILMTCSNFIADWMKRLPILVTVGAGILAITAGELILTDHEVARVLVDRGWGCYSVGLYRAVQNGEAAKWLDAATVENLRDSSGIGRIWVGCLIDAAITALVLASAYAWRLVAKRGESQAVKEALTVGGPPDTSAE